MRGNWDANPDGSIDPDDETERDGIAVKNLVVGDIVDVSADPHYLAGPWPRVTLQEVIGITDVVHSAELRYVYYATGSAVVTYPMNYETGRLSDYDWDNTLTPEQRERLDPTTC